MITRNPAHVGRYLPLKGHSSDITYMTIMTSLTAMVDWRMAHRLSPSSSALHPRYVSFVSLLPITTATCFAICLSRLTTSGRHHAEDEKRFLPDCHSYPLGSCG